MSAFGFSIGDIICLLKLAYRLAGTLRKKAVESFERCQRNYQNLCRVVKYLDVYAHILNVHNTGLFKDTLREIVTLQGELASRIATFSPSLGEDRPRASFFKGAIAKIKWVHKEEEDLEKLCRDLESRTNSIQIAVSCPIPQQPSGDQFTFEDACRNVNLVSFSDIDNWEHFYELLLRMHKHKTAIEEGSYVIHNSTTGKYILPSSPCKKPFRDLIASGERIEMSIIFPYEDSYTAMCANCKERRPDITLVESTCDKCGLWIRFLDSSDDDSDPLTQLAIEDIQNSGFETFVTEFLSEIDSVVASIPPMERHAQDECLENRIKDTFPKGRTFRRSPKIRDFRRVTFCVPQNPNFKKCLKDYDRAEKHLAKVMEGSKRRLKYAKMKDSDLPLKIAARAMGSRLGGRIEALEEFSSALNLQYSSRSWKNIMSLKAHFEIYEHNVENTKFRFDLIVVKSRCFLWIFSHVLILEGKLIRSCSRALAPLYISKIKGPAPNHLLEKIVSVPLIASAALFRLTLDVALDAVELFRGSTPPVIVGAILRILKESRKLCLRHLSEGKLESYDLNALTDFEKKKIPGDAARESWIIACRCCLESVMRSEGENLGTVEECNQAAEYIRRVNITVIRGLGGPHKFVD